MPPGRPQQAPRPGQHVQIDGRDEVFVILRIDKTRHLADLLRQGAVRRVEFGIPLALLRVVRSAAAALESIDKNDLTEQAS